MTTVQDALAGVTRLGIDTPPIIYFVESHPKYDALVTEVFQRISLRQVMGITSVVSLAEVLTKPLQLDQSQLVQTYSNLLRHSLNFAMVSINADVAELAAKLRASYQLRTPDALQIAASLAAGCKAFLTNDTDLKRVSELQVLVLDELSL